MARANAAYYAERDPFQDFTTSPEITQVFGELLGLWAAVVWESMGRPDPVLLVECGPGRGSLMRDARRAMAQVAPGFHGAHRLHLVETSARLRGQQAALLAGAVWHDGVETLPAGPMIVLANEFLDALPIRQFVRRGDGWMERHVAGGALIEAPAEGPGRVAAEGEVVEVCEPALAFAGWLGSRVGAQGGAGLILDYGPAVSAVGDSLQALQGGRPASPFGAPGAADLTAHVDFAAVAAAAVGAEAHGPVQQGPFLARLGLFQRTGVLARTQKGPEASRMVAAAQRLAEPDRMGGLFKVLALCQPGLPTPPGFE